MKIRLALCAEASFASGSGVPVRKPGRRFAQTMCSCATLACRAKSTANKEASLEHLRLAASRHGYTREIIRRAEARAEHHASSSLDRSRLALVPECPIAGNC